MTEGVNLSEDSPDWFAMLTASPEFRGRLFVVQNLCKCGFKTTETQYIEPNSDMCKMCEKI